MIDLIFKSKIEPKTPPQTCGWLESKLSDVVMSRLWNYIEKYKNIQNHNNFLAGNISSSWLLNDDDNWFFENVLIKLCSEYAENFENLGSGYGTTKQHLYCLSKFWVNFQKQYEFNPTHTHIGCIYSFVVWMKIPYDYRDQHSLPFSLHSNYRSASNFEFITTNPLGQITSFKYFLDQSSEGTILFFPAKLPHQVYPFFNCDDERISISGNIALDTSKFFEIET